MHVYHNAIRLHNLRCHKLQQQQFRGLHSGVNMIGQ